MVGTHVSFDPLRGRRRPTPSVDTLFYPRRGDGMCVGRGDGKGGSLRPLYGPSLMSPTFGVTREVPFFIQRDNE